MPPVVRHTACLTALLGILLSGQGGLVAHALFQIRQEYIAAHHCENRFEPASTCNGLCFLKKRLADSEHQRHDQNTTAPVSPILFFLPAADPGLPSAPEARQGFPEPERTSARSGHDGVIDPPPRAA